MAKILKMEIAPDGTVEAFYTFTDSEGLPQNAGMQVVVDGSPLVAAALAEVDDALAKLAPAAPSPAALVDAMTKLGDAKAAEKSMVAQLNAVRAQAQAEARAWAGAKAQADAELAAKQQAIADADAQLAAKTAALADTVPAAAETKPGGLTP